MVYVMLTKGLTLCEQKISDILANLRNNPYICTVK